MEMHEEEPTVVKRSIFAHHLDESCLIRSRVENLALCVFGVELRCPRTFEVSSIRENNFGVLWHISGRQKLWDVASSGHADEVVDFLQRLSRLLCKIELHGVFVNDVLDTRVQLHLFGEVESIDGRELNARVGLVHVAVVFLVSVALEHIGFALCPVKLKRFLWKWNGKLHFRIIWKINLRSMTVISRRSGSMIIAQWKLTFNCFSVWLALPK